MVEEVIPRILWCGRAGGKKPSRKAKSLNRKKNEPSREGGEVPLVWGGELRGCHGSMKKKRKSGGGNGVN